MPASLSAAPADAAAALIDVPTVARLLPCSPRHVMRLAQDGRMPAPRKLSHLVRFVLDAGRPMFRIRATAEKGKRDRTLPMAPEFALWLRETPREGREGFVFDPRPVRKYAGRLRLDTASQTIAGIGEAAGVKVAETAKGPRYASAHDLRRAFGFRWSIRVMPPALKELMRHANITTTMEFYVGRNAEATAETVWAAFAKQTAKPAIVTADGSAEEKPQTV